MYKIIHVSTLPPTFLKPFLPWYAKIYPPTSYKFITCSKSSTNGQDWSSIPESQRPWSFLFPKGENLIPSLVLTFHILSLDLMALQVFNHFLGRSIIPVDWSKLGWQRSVSHIRWVNHRSLGSFWGQCCWYGLGIKRKPLLCGAAAYLKSYYFNQLYKKNYSTKISKELVALDECSGSCVSNYMVI